jgi:hypothetical protein
MRRSVDQPGNPVTAPVIDDVSTIRPRPDAISASRQACTL